MSRPGGVAVDLSRLLADRNKQLSAMRVQRDELAAALRAYVSARNHSRGDLVAVDRLAEAALAKVQS